MDVLNVREKITAEIEEVTGIVDLMAECGFRTDDMRLLHTLFFARGQWTMYRTGLEKARRILDGEV